MFRPPNLTASAKTETCFSEEVKEWAEGGWNGYCLEVGQNGRSCNYFRQRLEDGGSRDGLDSRRGIYGEGEEQD